ncbi:Asp-tRNA(Asn)/Glu-tRNA(Gln) amidotransferase subunit GatA [Hathewaya limosa]|uniref:Glutamyl-tRNA(Gln) amidotransferase subunit A n=1 Tax=Hathewaya limosa TaxID=1536 RepID=A0ABU0JUB7_HATLI|nr:Asp-tRNA(Asn)/Glu-tRNA(Gln) amidotransferase subunit GatA [Hathewaya limosa]MDQ0480659.1 aspartyl-tRNA(Asn)/glutamyl-tRNA(Gln) amidotransferase subunit A [Hathewaya limosa]
MNIIDYKVHELIELVEKKQVKVREVNEAFLDNYRKIEPKVQAFLTVNEDEILNKAEYLDKELENGKNIGKLKGIPIGIKDNINVLDMKTTCASRMLEDFISPYEATLVNKIKDENGIIFGKTNMDEFAIGSSGENSYFKNTRNPKDLLRVPGGSSSGSAAAVSSKEVPIAIGTDTGGSVREPAAFCGLVGFKPTYGTISRYGVISFASTLDTVGILSSDVKDSMIMYDVLKGKDIKDATTVENKKDYNKKLFNKDLKEIKIAVPKKIFNWGLHEEVERNFKESLSVLKECGAEIDYIDVSALEYVLETYYVLSSAEVSSNLGRFDGIRYGKMEGTYNSTEELYRKVRSENFNSEVKKRILLGTFILAKEQHEEYYRRALKIRSKIRKEFEDIFKRYNAFITPTTLDIAFKLGQYRNSVDMYNQDKLTVIANLVGAPAISIPCGIKENMPLGLQVMTMCFNEEILFKIAYSFESMSK